MPEAGEIRDAEALRGINVLGRCGADRVLRLFLCDWPHDSQKVSDQSLLDGYVLRVKCVHPQLRRAKGSQSKGYLRRERKGKHCVRRFCKKFHFRRLDPRYGGLDTVHLRTDHCVLGRQGTQGLMDRRLDSVTERRVFRYDNTPPDAWRSRDRGDAKCHSHVIIRRSGISNVTLQSGMRLERVPRIFSLH